MASLSTADQEAFRAAVKQVCAALEPFRAHARQRVLDYAAAEGEVTR